MRPQASSTAVVNAVGYVPLRSTHGVIGWIKVDSRDLRDVARFSWSQRNGYAARSVHRPGCNPRPEYMHRRILGLEVGDGRTSDHLNRDRLDNRRSNLRVATRAENNQNVPARGRSRARGVTPTRTGRWKAVVSRDGQPYHVGTYATRSEAERAARHARQQLLPFAVD